MTTQKWDNERDCSYNDRVIHDVQDKCIDAKCPMHHFKCEHFKHRIEMIYNFRLVKLEVCREWWRYMLQDYEPIEILAKLGYNYKSLFTSYGIKSGNGVRIYCNNDYNLVQIFQLHELLATELLNDISLFPYHSSSSYKAITKRYIEMAYNCAMRYLTDRCKQSKICNKQIMGKRGNVEDFDKIKANRIKILLDSVLKG